MLMGYTLFAMCVAEVPVFFYTGALLKRVGIDTVLHVVLGCLVLRSLAYTAMPRFAGPWLAAPVCLLITKLFLYVTLTVLHTVTPDAHGGRVLPCDKCSAACGDPLKTSLTGPLLKVYIGSAWQQSPRQLHCLGICYRNCFVAKQHGCATSAPSALIISCPVCRLSL